MSLIYMNKILLVSGIPIATGLVLLFVSNFILQSNASTPQPVLDPKITYDNIIPATDYAARGYTEIGLQYPPASIANKCLFYFSHVRNETAWTYGVYTAEWLAERGHKSEKYIVFTYDFDWKPYNLTTGWKSALAQSAVAECFLKAYEHTKDTKYMIMAKKSLIYLEVPVLEGGVMIDKGNNRWWYEEYPSKGGSYVLNGHQSVLIAISKYLVVDDDPAIRELFDNGLRALKVDALLYDNGINNSFYDRLGHPALNYHQNHITNFQRLYDITKDEEWLEIKKAFME